MPGMDSPQISGILEGASSAVSVSVSTGMVVGVHVSKRPRDDGSPLPGKRGRGENGDISLTLQIPVASTAPLVLSGEHCTQPQPPPTPPPPLCESPSKMNQAPSARQSFTFVPNAFAPFSGGGSTAKSTASTATGAVPSAVVDSGAAGSLPAVARRKHRVPPIAAPSLGATDPIFHAALLRLLHRRGGNTCPEAVSWRWHGDTPARFNHWPCALHPCIMDLLACVSAGEERVVLTGCDVKEDCDQTITQQPPPQPREVAWPGPRPRTPPAQRGPTSGAGAVPVPMLAPVSPAAATPVSAYAKQQKSAPQTPLSALRRPGSSRRSSNRVRFSTHDMSVVDTPDPARGGSEEGMISALGSLESILSAAEQVRGLVVARGGGECGSREEQTQQQQQQEDAHYQGYFDRFSSGAGCPSDQDKAIDSSAEAAAAATSTEQALTGEKIEEKVETREGAAVDGSSDRQDGDGFGRRHDDVVAGAGALAVESVDDEQQREQDAARAAEAESAREDATAFVAVLDEIASSHSAPEDLCLPRGWGPEHSNAARFYARELGSLCGVRYDGVDAVTGETSRAVVGSHLRVRYLDVLSSLVRYNLKVRLSDGPDLTSLGLAWFGLAWLDCCGLKCGLIWLGLVWFWLGLT